MTGDLTLLRQLGEALDRKIGRQTVRDLLITHMLKIRRKGGPIDFIELNRAQQEYSQRCAKRNIVLKARQLGVTTYVAARFFIQTITHPGSLTVQVAHTEDSAEAIFTIVRRFWQRLPARMKRGALKTSRSNVRQLVFPELDSEYRVETADDNAGRGMTIHHLHCSEVSRWPHGGRDTLASLRAAVVPSGEIVLESTPNGASGVFYEEWQKADETEYTRHFFPWWYDASYVEDVSGGSVLPYSEEEKALAELHGLTAGQIAWRRETWKTMRANAAQEYAEDAISCFLASGECVFELAAVEQAAAHAGQPVESRDNGRLLVWFPPNRGGAFHGEARQYIIGVDTAGGGTEGDYSCAQVIERSMGLQCAELHGHFPPFELAARVKELAQKYENALVAVERNNQGFGVLAHLKDQGYENLYMHGGQEGWLTSVVTRPAMIENLAAVLVAQPELFHSPRLLEEMKTFVRHGDGRTEASEGAHDDCVMAMAIAFGVRKEDAGRLRKRLVEMASLVVG
ncbi:MAG TPA: terminase [Verrucomicrobiae bacterium]|nr:terminase [Verrucomicrobiae bacterium]